MIHFIVDSLIRYRIHIKDENIAINYVISEYILCDKSLSTLFPEIILPVGVDTTLLTLWPTRATPSRNTAPTPRLVAVRI